MNRINLLSTDGRIFYLDPKNDSFELLETTQLKESNIKLKKLSSSSYGFWCILANFEICLFVYHLDTPIKHQVVTYENQVSLFQLSRFRDILYILITLIFKRRYNIFKADSFTNRLLPSDRYQFSSESGHQNLPKESFECPSENWIWDSEWSYEETNSKVKNAFNFYQQNYSEKIFIKRVGNMPWIFLYRNITKNISWVH